MTARAKIERRQSVASAAVDATAVDRTVTFVAVVIVAEFEGNL